MFWNYLKIALRNLRKNSFYALINIGGLTIGLSIYLFGNLLVNYESTHDEFFSYSDRIYTLGTDMLPRANRSSDHFTTTFSALAPILETELVDIEAIARTIGREYVVGNDSEAYYERVVFTDSELLNIFDFNYVQGGSDALDSPNKVLLTTHAAIKYFGDTDVQGKIITLNNQHNFYVSAVIDIPKNSHFSQNFILISMDGLESISDMSSEGNWSNLGGGDFTYVLLPSSLDGRWLQTQLDAMFERVTGDNAKTVAKGYVVSPLNRANLSVWDRTGFSALNILRLLCLLVLITAGVNFTNLAAAQAMKRSREVGLRKAVGASQSQLLMQFLVESLVVSAIAMICAIAVLELILPVFNSLTSKVLSLDYASTLPWLLWTTLVVGLLAGLYPAWLILRTSPIDALKDIARKGRSGAAVRACMVSVQFAISAFMLAIVAIMFAQNRTVEQASYVFPRSEIFTLHRLEVNVDRLYPLQRELEQIPGIASVAFSSQIPYEQNNNTFQATSAPGDEAAVFSVNEMMITPEFFTTYDIPFVAGRNLDRGFAMDEFHRIKGESPVINVVVNEMTVERLGFSSAQEAINQRLFPMGENSKFSEAIIVGVVPTQNIQGLFSSEKPWVFLWSMDPNWMDTASIRLNAGNFMSVIDDIELAWKKVIPDYPMNGRFLDDDFNRTFSIMVVINLVVGGFASIAILLATIGLLGLSAFYSAQRAREIGIRKALGASSKQIVQMLVWQFSKPVFWALVFALPAAFSGANSYLDLFAERIESPLLVIIVAGFIALLLGAVVVSGQAIKIACANPVTALRHE